MQRHMTLTARFAAGLLLGAMLAAPATAQTVTAQADNRSGSILATNNVGRPVSLSYSITPGTMYSAVDFVHTVVDGGATASLNSASSWLNLGPGNSTTGFTAAGSLDVSLGAINGLSKAVDTIQVSLNVSGALPGQTVPFAFQGSLSSLFSNGSITLVGPGVNLAFSDTANWGQTVPFVNGTYTLTVSASSTLEGMGPDVGGLDYSVSLTRVPTIPANDECANATPISEGAIPVSNINATGITYPSFACTGDGYFTILNDVFFRYVANATGTATVSTCGGMTIDTVMAAFTGPCNAPTWVACNDDSCGLQSTLSFPTVCGETYTIVLGSYLDGPGDTGSGTMTLTQTGGCFDPADCTSAGLVQLGYQNVGNWWEGLGDVVLPASCGLGGDSTIHKGSFWSWTAPATGQVTISTCETAQSGDPVLDTRLAAFTGSCADPQWVACNDNACGVLSSLSFWANCGVTYTIVFGTADGTSGTQTLHIAQTGALCNDECFSASPVHLGANSVTIVGATGVTNVPAWCSGVPLPIFSDVFYQYVPTESGTVTVSTCGSVNFDSRLAAFTGPCEAPSWVACNDDGAGCHGGSSVMSFQAYAGVGYIIVLGNNGDPSQVGSGVMNISVVPLPGTCELAQPVHLGINEVSTIGLTGELVLPGQCDEGFGSVASKPAYFLYDATATGTATFSTCSYATFDTKLAVFSGSCGNLVLVGCNDDSPSCTSYRSELTVPIVCGERYVVVLGGYGGQSGNATLTIAESGSCVACPADLSGNGVVGPEDLATLLGQWGTSGSADFDGSGSVSSQDLAILLGAWGGCP